MPATRPTTATPTRRAVLRSAAALGATAGLAGCAQSADRSFPDADWPMAGGGPRNTSSVDGTFPEAVTEAWRTDVGGWPITQPVVVDGTVYVGTDRRFRAVDAADGSQLWESRLRERDANGVAPPEVAGSPAYAATDDVLVVTTYEGGREGRGGRVAGYDAATGERRWERTPAGRYAYSVRVADGTAYLRTSTECLALSAAEGDIEWRREGFEPLRYETFNMHEPFGVGVAPTVGDGTVYVADRNRLRALSVDTGADRWTVDLPYCLSAPAVHGDRVYARGYSSESWTVALTPQGREEWRAPVGGLSAPAATDDVAFVVDGDLVALDAATGDERWRWDLRTDVVGAAPVTADGTVVALGNRSAALSHERPGFGLGSRVRWTLPNQTTETVPPAVGGGHLYVVNPFTDHLVAYRG
ncbi:PQQ-binding-like beta-propeller repeat protein [Salinigranum marinum]|uniref:PQQ-binding-like beta-propeller repeat protein n=1 Tax=Salinigranum marinum TaxID=1515595 RepID=UPI00298A066C|nr:PQQ-binding-like beta-propeller repeat protein [Salinigranum marinum]